MKSRAMALLAREGKLQSVICYREISARHLVYAVTNGPHVLQIGKGSNNRMSKVMRGALAGKHNKAFICSLAEVVFNDRNEYCYVDVGTKENAVNAEQRIHAGMGIQTNRDVATWIHNVPMNSMEQVHRWMCNQVRSSRLYSQLDSVEQQMAEELFDLITYGVAFIKRRNTTVRSCQGDLLEGNILMKLQKSYLISILDKLSNSYFRYGKHRMSILEFLELKKNYSYVPKGTQYSIRA